MSWTTPAELRAQVRKLWDRGVLLAGLAENDTIFPRRLILKGPNSKELGERFGEVRNWIAHLDGAARFYRIVWRSVNHRVLGTNSIPDEIWIDSLQDALDLIGKRSDAERFAALVTQTRERQPLLLPWMAKRPLRVLALAQDWPRLLAVVTWLQLHPRPGIYLRQVDIAGVHSKFIEGHRGVLGELFDLVLPTETVDAAFSGGSGFCRRYGFRDKPLRIRFRILDPALAVFPTKADLDIAVTQECFAQLDLPVAKIFITENEVNFLAFPQVAGGMVIFGAGYGFENLATADWLRDREIHYWGDIDTHGFAILNQLRGYFPQAASFLMDRGTLLAHRPLWGVESQPETRDLQRLTVAERLFYDDLRLNRLGDQVRLEQERIGFVRVVEALEGS